MKPPAPKKPTPKRSLLLSLLLLLGAYSSFSWFLYRVTAPITVWVFVILFALIQALLLTALSKGLRKFIRQWLSSDLGYFSIVMILAVSITLALVWYQVFEYVVLMLGTEILARLDLQNAGLNQWQALFVLTLVSVLGLAVGWSAREVLIISASMLGLAS